MTKKTYLAAVARNEAAIAEGEARVELLRQAFEAGQMTTGESTDVFNLENDLLRELEQERNDIERAWSRRNWTGADYASYELIVNNCD